MFPNPIVGWIAMPTRSRTSIRKRTQGRVYNGSTGEHIGNGSYDFESRAIDDTYGKKVRKTPPLLRGMLPASNCRITYWQQKPVLAYRELTPIAFEGYPSSAWLPHDSVIPLIRPGYTTAQDNARLALLLLERTNPFRPEFSVPVYIKELVEIGGMFRLAARTFAGFAGGAYLNYKFGWQTFVQDLGVLNQITKALERRIRELISLQKHGGLSRRNVYLDSRGGSNVANNVLINSSWGWSLYTNRTASATVKVHGSIRWVPSRDFAEDLKKLGVVNLAFRKLFDLDKIDSLTTWQMIPFSWLADFFVDIGGYLSATNGQMVLTPYDICIMRVYESIATYTPTVPVSSNGIRNLGNGRGYVRIYDRTYYPTPPSFPTIRRGLLSWSQWKIVLALFAKFRG